MRQDRVTVLQLAMSGLLTALLAIAINVATGGRLPGPFAALAWLAWPIVAVLAVALIALSIRQHRLAGGGQTSHRPAVPAELPPARPIHGRARELAAIRNARARTPVVVITGAPGAGKTALAVRAAHDLRRHYPDGQLYADLRGAGTVVTPDAVLAAFLRALGEPDTAAPLPEITNRFRTVVAGLRLVIVLDDALEEDQILPLLPGGTGSLVLITSRRPLTAGHPVRLGGLGPGDARALLSATAGRARITADPAGTDRIIAACAGLPLAVQLAAARLRDRPAWRPGDLADHLDDDARRLGELKHGDAAVRATFHSAYDGLSGTDRLVFRRAGAHPGTVFGTGAAAALTGLDEATAGDALDRLTDAMLADSPAPGRYRLHDLLRLYARELCDDDAALDRLLDWLTTTAAPGAWRDLELDNALAALGEAVRTGRYEAVSALVERVHPLLDRTGDHVHRLPLWQAGAAAAAALGDDRRRVRALREIAHSHHDLGRLDAALGPAREALDIAERLDDRREIARAARELGEVLRGRHDFGPAEEHLRRALALFEETGTPEEGIEIRSALGTLYNLTGRPGLAVDLISASVGLFDPPFGDPRHAWAVLGLGTSHRMLGDLPRSAGLVRLSATWAATAADDYVLGYCAQELGLIAREERRFAEAEQEFRRMRDLHRRIRHDTGVATAHHHLGVLAHRRGRHRHALSELTVAMDLFARLGNTARLDRSRAARADVLDALGRHAEAAADRAAAR
ncbi:ATP-binding protein [Catenuloplanes indicus]|uniref:Tetratricopeptide (TPR) repeat protein n=1 Tax=Catenuloplanes indicus TaxID=137267 RepID=A0AAE3VZI0_9ACTN|nr:tetratricopeptide repeat protein [Catenuloplanes indicus]MDQ0366696.1 tetratricopeptide (TPR) repeat protein [Catenuloplanes indicus]